MRNATGAVSLLLTLIGIPGTYENLSQWRGWAKFILGASYSPICVLLGFALFLVFMFWGRIFQKRPGVGLPRIAITSSSQSGGQTGLLNISLTGGQPSGMTAEEKTYRERLADELDGLGHTFFKRVNEWYTARVEETGPHQKDQKAAAALEAKAQAEARMNELDRVLSEKVSRSAAAHFRRNKPDEPIATSWIKVIKEGQAINFMWHRSKRFDDIVARVRNGEEPIKWPPATDPTWS